MIEEFRFKDFLLNEQQNILSQKIGNVLSALQTLSDDISNLGSKDKNTYADRISSDIRTILRGNWPKEQVKFLATLQKVAVAMKKTINEKGSIEDLLPNVITELENILEKMGTPVNSLVPTEVPPATPDSISPPVKNPNAPEPQKVASAEPPEEPQNIEKIDQGRPPNSAPGVDQNLGAQPLGGTSGPLLGM